MKRGTRLVSHDRPAVRTRRLLIGSLLALGLATCCIAAILAGAYTRMRDPADPLITATFSPPAGPVRRTLQSRLTLQPEANRMRRRLGRRFVNGGREIVTLSGTLLVGSQNRQIQIIRRLEDHGERVSIVVDQSSHTWRAGEGARTGGRPPGGADRSIIERLVLDSPDQFVLAQLRGASYHAVARDTRPEGVGNSDDYQGPTWDVVRIGEPQEAPDGRPKSPWRLYLINTATGLIDKVISTEDGDGIEAELSGWSDLGGELAPGRIIWRRNGQVVMELTLTQVAFGPGQ